MKKVENSVIVLKNLLEKKAEKYRSKLRKDELESVKSNLVSQRVDIINKLSNIKQGDVISIKLQYNLEEVDYLMNRINKLLYDTEENEKTK